MEPIIIAETPKTPLFKFDTDNNSIKIEGKIISENPINFFSRLDEILDSYKVKAESESLKVDIYVDYFNTVCSKYFLKFLRKVISTKQDASKININWYFDSDDTEIKESGDDYSMILNHHFNFIEIKN